MTPAQYAQALLQRHTALVSIRETSGNSTKYTPMIEKVGVAILSLIEGGFEHYRHHAINLAEVTLKDTQL